MKTVIRLVPCSSNRHPGTVKVGRLACYRSLNVVQIRFANDVLLFSEFRFPTLNNIGRALTNQSSHFYCPCGFVFCRFKRLESLRGDFFRADSWSLAASNSCNRLR